MIVTASCAEQDLSVHASADQKLAWLSANPKNATVFASSANGPAHLDLLDPSFEIVRHFVEHLANASQSGALDRRQAPPLRVNWEVIRTAITGCHSIEQAIGRAVVVADQMSRRKLDNPNGGDVLLGAEAEDHPFFAAGTAEIVPDFGDQSRYRTRLARRFSGLFGSTERS